MVGWELGGRSAVAVVVVWGAVAALAGGLALPAPPRLIIGDSVHDDFAALAQETWGRFLGVFWARRGCFGDVRLEAAYDLRHRAGYDPDTATVLVRVPGTAAMLQSGLVHEWAHHLEFQCPAQRELRSDFLAAQGLPPDTPWRPADAGGETPASAWSEIPSEQFAEATVILVLGEEPIATGAQVSPEAVDVVRGWAEGGR